MSKTDAFATIRRARSLHERYEAVPASVVAVALCLATYADGRWGTNIRPGHERVARETRLHLETVRKAIRWLEAHDELRCDKRGARGSAACYTWLGVVDTPASHGGSANTPALDGYAPAPGGDTNPTSQPPDPSDPQDPTAPHPHPGKPCGKHPDVIVDPGYECYECARDAYYAEHGRRPIA